MIPLLIRTGLLALVWMPVFFINPVSQNITTLQRIHPAVYYLWGTTMLAILYRCLHVTWPLAFLAAGFLCPYTLTAGWRNDFHVWLQVAGILWIAASQLRRLIWLGEKKARTFFLVLGLSVSVMGACGHVSGLAEMVFATGMLVTGWQQPCPAHHKKTLPD